jgi:hypothetical protein
MLGRSSIVIPGLNRIQTAALYGLAARSQSETNLFTFDTTWNMAEMNTFLCQKIPYLFDHFAIKDPWIKTINSNNWIDGNKTWPYVLLARVGTHLEPAVLTETKDPTGADYYDNSGRQSAAPKQRTIYIGILFSYCSSEILTQRLLASRTAIRDAVYMKWKSNPDPGSPSEDLSEESESEVEPVPYSSQKRKRT